MRAVLTFLATVALAIPTILASHHDVSPRMVHHGIARRSNSSDTGMSLSKRAFTNARATHFVTGLGACGKTNVASDFIVALNHVQFGTGYPGPHCFQKIRITYKGISAVAEIRDRCPGCDYGMLDLTNGLFSHFVPLHTDVFYMRWEFIDGDDDDDEPSKPSSVKPTSTKTTQKPTSTKTTVKSTTTHKSTTMHKSTTRATITSSSTSTSTTTTSTSTPTPTLPAGPQNIPNLQQAVLGLAELMGSAAAASNSNSD